MRKFKCLLVFIIFLSLKLPVHAQHNKHHIHDEHHIYHFGFGIGAAKFVSEDGISPAFHAHLLRKVNPELNWSVGLGYEGIVEEKLHSGINILLNYRPVDYLSFNIGPGIVLENDNEDIHLTPALHLESVFEFNMSGIHLGPMLGYGIDKEHQHFSVGIHIGFGME